MSKRINLQSETVREAIARGQLEKLARQASDRAKAELFADQPALPPINAADWRNFEGRAK